MKQLSARIQCSYYIASFSGLPDVGEVENLLALQDEESMHVGDRPLPISVYLERHWRDKTDKAFPLHFCILSVMMTMGTQVLG